MSTHGESDAKYGPGTVSVARGAVRDMAAGERQGAPGRRDADGYEFVEHPSHYGGAGNPYEALKVIMANPNWTWPVGSAYKHMARVGLKPGDTPVRDLRKAAFYLSWEADRLEALERAAGAERESAEPVPPVTVEPSTVPDMVFTEGSQPDRLAITDHQDTLHSPVDLSEATKIIRFVDEGPGEVVTPIDVAGGIVPLPTLPLGYHQIEYEVHWLSAPLRHTPLVSTFPARPVTIQVVPPRDER